MKIVPFVTIEKTSFSLTLISRRSIHRNGRRFNTRGVDEEGNVANFVETEQIIHTRDGQLYSFVQVYHSLYIYMIDSRKYSFRMDTEALFKVYSKDTHSWCKINISVNKHRIVVY